MKHGIFSKLMSLLLALVMIAGMLPVFASAAEASYDFELTGSTISFLDIYGELMTEETAWTEAEHVVENWHVFMYRKSKDNLKLGYSPEGELFLPHKTYEGETADLLYVKGNTMFRVTVTKDARQVFDGSQLLHAVMLHARYEETILANAPVYAQTPFGFVFMGITDSYGAFSIHATDGQFTLWVASNEGYLVSKTFYITEGMTDIDFSREIAETVEIDISGRTQAAEGGPGYMAALGLPGETDPTNMLTTSYLSPEKTVRVTPGVYSVACGIFVENQQMDDYSGLWVKLKEYAVIREKTDFSFVISDFGGKLALNNKGALVSPLDELQLSLYAEDENGYQILGEAGSYWFTKNRVVVTVDGAEYPYTFEIGPFSMLYEAYLYAKDDSETILFELNAADYEFTLPFSLFGNTEQEYVMKYYPEWDAGAYPDLFPKDVSYGVSLRTQAASADTFRILTANRTYYGVYYIDENGYQQQARCDYGANEYYYLLPACVENGDGLVLVVDDWSEMRMDFNAVTVMDALFEETYVFEPHEVFTAPAFNVKNGENDERDYNITVKPIITVGGDEIALQDATNMAIPLGDYAFEVSATYEVYDEETWEKTAVDYISYRENYTLSEDAFEVDIDYSGFESFGIDASSFFPKEYWMMGDYRKQFALYFNDGTVRAINWDTAPMTVYADKLPYYGTAEMYYNETTEMWSFSPFVSYGQFWIDEGKTYRFDFTPAAITVADNQQFPVNGNTVLSYEVTDGFGMVMDDAWNLLNPFVVHRPLEDREYPFRDAEGNPVDYRYAVDVYYRAKGENEYRKVSIADYTQADLGILPAGEYEGYVEINFDAYRDEYLVEYPMEKGIMYDEWWGENYSVYDNVDRVLHGILRDEFTFTVSGEAHQCVFGHWVDNNDQMTHTRTCECGNWESADHRYDNGTVIDEAAHMTMGIIEYACLDCGYRRYEYTPKTTEHQWSNWTPDKDGTHSRTCECGATETGDCTYEISGIEPTHTTPGATRYTCKDCGYFYEEEIPATSGHQWEPWVEYKPDAENYHIRFCACGESETAPHRFEENICIDCGFQRYDDVPDLTLRLEYPSLSFEDEIFYNVYYSLNETAGIVEMGLMTFDERLVDGTIADAVDVIPGFVSDGDTYMVRSKGIPAKNLGDTLYFKVYARTTDGTYIYSEIAGYHAVAYARTVLNSDGASAKAKALVVAMLNYGASAQQYFGYKTDSLMNASLTAQQLAMVSAYDESMVQAVVKADSTKVGSFVMNGGYADIYPTVSFEGAFSINFYFVPNKTVDSAPVMYYWDAKTYASVDVLTPENATGVITMEHDGTKWGAAVEGIAAKALDDTIYVAGFYTSGGASYPTGIIAYSLGSYCKTLAANGEAFGAATAVYGYYAKAYFA